MFYSVVLEAADEHHVRISAAEGVFGLLEEVTRPEVAETGGELPDFGPLINSDGIDFRAYMAAGGLRLSTAEPPLDAYSESCTGR